MVAVIVGVTLASCGASDEERVEAAVIERFEAWVDRDAVRFCELTSPEDRRFMTDDESGTVQACAASEPFSDEPVTVRQRRAVERLEVTSVNVDDDKATAVVRAASGRELELELRESDGEWR